MQTAKSTHSGKYGGGDETKTAALYARHSHADGQGAISNPASRLCAQTPQNGYKLPDGNTLANWRLGADISQSQLAGLMQQWSGDKYPSLRTVQMIEQSRQKVTPYYWTLFQLSFGFAVLLPTEVSVSYDVPLVVRLPVEPCPTCGDVHSIGDCHGKHGQPVFVADGERVVSSKPKRTGRKRLRREMTTAQAKAWDNLSIEERDRVLGI